MRQRIFLLLFPLLLDACGTTHASSVHLVLGRADVRLGNGTPIQRMVVEPSDGLRPLTRAMDHAQSSIDMETYILTDTRVVRALERAAAQGVDTRVMLEPHPFGMGLQPHHMADILLAAGVQVRWAPPGFLLTHAKYFLLDGRLAVVGTANFSRSAFTRNREFILLDGNPADVLQLSNIFRDDWDRLPVVSTDPSVVVAPLNAREKLSELVSSARRFINLYAEELADNRLERLLGAQATRGVRVRVILAATARRSVVPWLSHHNVAVRFLNSPYVHAKSISVDGRSAFVGSENISTASLDGNREVGLIVRGEVVSTLDSIFKTDWSRAIPVS